MSNNPKLLLHVCCIGCGAAVAQTLSDEYSLTLFFYNPNIFPVTEYEMRRDEAARVAGVFNWPWREGDHDHARWLTAVDGLEKEKERGARCSVCYEYRLAKTAELAEKSGFPFFGTTLSISPHKDAAKINAIGRDLAKTYNVTFLERDFKKKGGFSRSVALSRELNLYRQTYCGCEFSLKPAD